MTAPTSPRADNVSTGMIILLVDDQPIIAEAVKRMLADQPDIVFHYCQNPAKAIEMANQVRPTVILQDLVMPDIDGLMLVKFFRANPATRDTPMIVLSSKEEPIVKAEAFARGANDYLVKLPDRVELLARVRYHSRAYINLLQRNEAYAAIARNEKILAEQIEAASRYLMALLPAKQSTPVRLDWRYVPSANLGGDTLGYDWLDDDHLAMYILDVTGHGLDSALFAVTIMNVLRSRALPSVDFRVPGQVLDRLNDAFPMEQYGFKNFTIFYCVYHRPTRKLVYSGGGHPDAVILHDGGVIRLPSDGPMMGMMPWPAFETGEVVVPEGATLYLLTDGVHEIHRTDGSDWTFDELIEFFIHPPESPAAIMDRLHEYVVKIHGSPSLDDDFSLIEAKF